MAKKKKPKTPKIEYYPSYQPTIRVPFPEFADVVEKLSKVDESLDKEIPITRDAAWLMYEIVVQMAVKPGTPSMQMRDYYTGVIRKWLNTEPKPPERPASS